MYESLYHNLFYFFENRSKVFHATLSVLLGCGIGYLDYLTSDIDFVLFYIVPIFLTTWFIGKNAGRAASVLSCITSFSANMDTMLAKSTVKHLVWDFTLDLLFFIVLGFMFRMLREKLDAILDRSDTLMYQVKSSGKNSLIHEFIGERHSAGSPDATSSED